METSLLLDCAFSLAGREGYKGGRAWEGTLHKSFNTRSMNFSKCIFCREERAVSNVRGGACKLGLTTGCLFSSAHHRIF